MPPSAKGKKLSDAYVELRASDSKLGADVKVSATKAGKQFGSALNSRLKQLDLAPIDVKADPKEALAAIEATRARLQELSRSAETVEVKVRTERAITQLERFRKQLGDVGGDAAPDFVARFVGRFGPLMASAPVSPHLLAALAPAAPAVASLIAGAVTSGVALGAAGAGVALVLDNPRVERASAALGDRVGRSLREGASSFEPVVLQSLGIIGDTFDDLAPRFRRIFDVASTRVVPLTMSVARAMEILSRSVEIANDRADPLVEVLTEHIPRAAELAGQSIEKLSQDAQSSADTLDSTLTVVEATIGQFVNAVSLLNKIAPFVAPIAHVGKLTEDTAKKTKTATEQYRGYTLAVEDLAAQKKKLADIDTQVREQMDQLLFSTGAVTSAMRAQKTVADLLRQAHEQMKGAQISQTEAAEAYQAAIDQQSEALGRNGNSLNINTAAGRANRDAIQDRIRASNEMLFADVEAGVGLDQARKRHEARTEALRKEARQAGLNKTETDKLIGTYNAVPRNKTTELVVDGFGQIARTLADLYAFQRSLATGRSLEVIRAQVSAALRGGFAGDPRAFHLKREGGSITGPGLHGVDSVPVLAAPGEYMQPTPAVDYYGVAAMEAIKNRQVPRDILKGYQAGGLIGYLGARDWGRGMRYEVDVRGARIPSREEVANRVIPEFGDWPASPSAQRGDSGVWRRIMMLVRNSGIPYSFGNAYRPGDPRWHGSGRAVDFMGYNQDRLAQFFLNMQPRILELIHRTDRGDYAVTRGRRVSMPTQLPLHRNHLHVAMDNGGYLMPGWNPPIYNGTGRPEPVTPAPVMDEVIELLADLIEVVKGDGVRVAGALRGPGPNLRTIARAR